MPRSPRGTPASRALLQSVTCLPPALCACPDPRDVGDVAPSPTFVEGMEACSVHVLSVSLYSECPRLVLELNILETLGF